VVRHRYEFSRNHLKMYLLERNRLLLLLTVYQARTLALLAVPLLALEAAMLAVSVRQGWWPDKLRGWWWLLTHAALVRQRRALVQGTRTRSDADLAGVLTARFEPGAESGVPATPALSRVAALYWRAVRPLLR
jgi:hypothetical protein